MAIDEARGLSAIAVIRTNFGVGCPDTTSVSVSGCFCYCQGSSACLVATQTGCIQPIHFANGVTGYAAPVFEIGSTSFTYWIWPLRSGFPITFAILIGFERKSAYFIYITHLNFNPLITLSLRVKYRQKHIYPTSSLHQYRIRLEHRI
jgi:hypothetical protein